MPPVSERELMGQVVGLARLCGWLVYHTHDSRRSPAGFVDLVLCHPGRRAVLFCELKAARGRVRPEQRAWLDALARAGADVRLWRPSSWPEIEALLTGGGA